MEIPPVKEFRRLAQYIIFAACIVYVAGWFIPLMDVDASQYAAMTREMLGKGDFLHFTDRGHDYLDKPPMIFWISGISMKIFGINQFAYRLPSFLATLLTLYSTFRLAKLFYGKQTGFIAVSILATTQAVFLINHDVRTDTNLICFVVFAVWQLSEYLEHEKWQNFIGGFVGVALAMLSKGPIGLVVPAVAIGVHLLIRRDWNKIFRVEWLAGLLIVAIILLPMAYGLYTQFDLEPQKEVLGKTGTSGLRFFFWTQSFGRITGESLWDNGAGPFFLTHSTLWAFLPWTFILILAAGREIKLVYYYFARRRKKKEFVMISAFIIPLILLSTSRYQLPHYAFVVYPFAAIIAAKYVRWKFYVRATRNSTASIFGFQMFILLLVTLFVFVLVWIAFAETRTALVILCVVAIACIVVLYTAAKDSHRLLLTTCSVAILVNACLNLFFYPRLLKYQSGSEFARAAVKSGVTKGNFYSYRTDLPYSMDFYADDFVQSETDFEKLVQLKGIWIYLNESDLPSFKEKRPDLKIIHSGSRYEVTMLRLDFLDPRTRENTVEKRCLVKL